MAETTEDVQIEKRNWHWRNSMRPARFFNLDARAGAPYVLLLFYIRPVTLFITAVLTILFIVLERRGLSFPAALRAFRCWMLGQRRPGWIGYRRRKMVDYG